MINIFAPPTFIFPPPTFYQIVNTAHVWESRPITWYLENS